jgi:hypothetical protein
VVRGGRRFEVSEAVKTKDSAARFAAIAAIEDDALFAKALEELAQTL